MTKTLTALLNEHLKRSGQDIKSLAVEIRALTPEDKKWYADRFKREGYADVVMGKDLSGAEIVLA